MRFFFNNKPALNLYLKGIADNFCLAVNCSLHEVHDNKTNGNAEAAFYLVKLSLGVMSKAARKVAIGKKQVAATPISTKNFFKTTIAAQCATAAPPLGPLLGQFGLNIGNFCKSFNEKTKHIKRGIPVPVTVRIKPDRSYDINMHTPPLAYYLMQAAGIEKGAMKDEPLSGKITLKHAYEIAKIKQSDPFSEYQIYDLEEVVKDVVGKAKGMGIIVVKDLDPKEYEEFLNKRKEFLAELEREREEKLKLKLQRV